MKLHTYQELAIKFALENKRVGLFIDLGLGKTAIALKVIQVTKQKAFVFAPLRVIYNTWPEEIAKWTPELTYAIIHGPDKFGALTSNADILLMNYEGLPWFSKQMIKFQRRMVIYDESSMCKSHSTKRFKFLRQMHGMWTDYRLCLSATPAPNGLHELWSQIYLLDQGKTLGKNITTFRRQYCRSFSYPGLAFTKYEVDPRYVNQIYQKIAPITYRLEAKDYLELPPITYNKIGTQLTAALTKKYKKLENDFFLELQDTEFTIHNAAQLSMKLRQFIQGGMYDEDKTWIEIHQIKLKALKELLETSAGQPILCPIQFRGELVTIQKAIGAVPVIAGGTSAQLAQKYIKSWNAGTIPLLLCHPASISHGVNLQTGGSTLLWYGLPWSLEQYSQLIGRLYRQGQKDPVIVHHLVMKNTVDEAILKALASKAVNQRALLDYLKDYRR